jgi:hypothetical protein
MAGVNKCLSLKRAFMPLLEISFLAKFTHPEEEKIIPSYVVNMTKFWLHLVKNNDQSSILADAFCLYNQTTNENSESWVGCIKEIFKCINLQFISYKYVIYFYVQYFFSYH